MTAMKAMQEIWEKQYNQVVRAIPKDWTTTFEDGFVGILPEHRNKSIVHTYWHLVQVGTANGWM